MISHHDYWNSLIMNAYCSEMQVDDEHAPPLVASVMAGLSRGTKTAWFGRMKEKMVAGPPGAPPTSGTAGTAAAAWQRQLQSERYGQQQ